MILKRSRIPNPLHLIHSLFPLLLNHPLVLNFLQLRLSPLIHFQLLISPINLILLRHLIQQIILMLLFRQCPFSPPLPIQLLSPLQCIFNSFSLLQWFNPLLLHQPILLIQCICPGPVHILHELNPSCFLRLPQLICPLLLSKPLGLRKLLNPLIQLITLICPKRQILPQINSLLPLLKPGLYLSLLLLPLPIQHLLQNPLIQLLFLQLLLLLQLLRKVIMQSNLLISLPHHLVPTVLVLLLHLLFLFPVLIKHFLLLLNRLFLHILLVIT